LPRFRFPSGGERRRRVTQEPALIADTLLDRPLGGFRRRALAFVMDLILAALVLILLFTSLSILDMHLADPQLLPAVRHYRAAAPGELREQARQEAGFRFFRILVERRPDLFAEDTVTALNRGELENFWELFGDEDTELVITASSETRIAYTGEQRRMILGSDILLGRFGSIFTWGAGMVAWFTLITWRRRGRTPGKWALRLRVARLDGRPLRLWDSFGRAGGYGASAAMLLLGFFEAIWHPNRQAAHDRIAGTVVLRDPPPIPGRRGLFRRRPGSGGPA
jgi:uncharacterized RDD family membrane protein YckC